MKLILFSGLLVIALHCESQAATVIHSLSGPAATQNPSGTLVVPQFDPSLGTLDSVSIMLIVNTSELSYSVSVTNGTINPTFGGYVSVNDSTNVSFTGAGGLGVSGSVNVGAISQTWSNLTAPTGISGTHSANSGNFSNTLTSGLTAYQGLGTVNIAWGLTNSHSQSTQHNTTTYTQTSPNPNTIPFTTTYGANSTFSGSLVYNFTPTPEPSRALLLWLGMAGCLLRRRR